MTANQVEDTFATNILAAALDSRLGLNVESCQDNLLPLEFFERCQVLTKDDLFPQHLMRHFLVTLEGKAHFTGLQAICQSIAHYSTVYYSMIQ